MLDKTDNPQAKSNSMIEWSAIISKSAIHSLEIPSRLYNSLELRRMKLCPFIQNGTSHNRIINPIITLEENIIMLVLYPGDEFLSSLS